MKEKMASRTLWVFMLLGLFGWTSCAGIGRLQYNVVQPRLDPIRPAEIQKLRTNLLYPYEKTDFQAAVTDMTPGEYVNFPFELPFYGLHLSRVYASLHGAVFSVISPNRYDFPLKFPSNEWPNKPDPAFLAVFLSKAKIGDNHGPADALKSGLYVRVIHNIAMDPKVEHREIREALMADIQEGMIGTSYFEPRHVIIFTWLNVSFGGSANNKVTNTHQMIIATDEVQTYAIFNYETLNWISSTEQNGDAANGLGGNPAFIGFNAGNGTRAYEYKPFSQHARIMSLTTDGGINNFPGRHIFRIDEQIRRGTCNYAPEANEELILSPENGHMLGGTLVNITGPCFQQNERIRVNFHDQIVQCSYRNKNHAVCISPELKPVTGHIEVSVLSGTGVGIFRNKFYIDNPMFAPELVHFKYKEDLNKLIPTIEPGAITVLWDFKNISQFNNVPITINLYGYLESSTKPRPVFIDTIAAVNNAGQYGFATSGYFAREHGWRKDFKFGFFQVNLTNFKAANLESSPMLWSRPIPLGWFFHQQWQRAYGVDWASHFCRQWEEDDRRMKNFQNDVPPCPCTLRQALADRGRFMSDFDCDRTGNNECFGSHKILHCVRSGHPLTNYGSGQECCYGLDEKLILNKHSKEGGIPNRAHPYGVYPYDGSTKVPGFSYWYHDRAPYFYCCEWQNENSESCQQFRLRRASQDCSEYTPPTAGMVFGDPHIITFDDLEYSFNGKGEYTLVNAVNEDIHLKVQGRFEQVIDRIKWKKLPATELTAVVMADNLSAIVEVQKRSPDTSRRYKLHVLVDGKPIYFDRQFEKIQTYKGVTIHTPSHILNQSHVIVIFQSGAGVEIEENEGFIAARVYLPNSFKTFTSGLLGNYTGDTSDDLNLPAYLERPPLYKNSTDDVIFREFTKYWHLNDSSEGHDRSLFTHEFGRSSAFYYDSAFVPEFNIETNSSTLLNEISQLCGTDEDNYQCRYDYIVTRNKRFALTTKSYADSFRRVKKEDFQL